MKPGNPFFTVIIPVYDKELYISKTITSVLNQTFSDFELLLVIDPCTDKTVEVIQTFTDERINIFHRDKPGPGGYAARNFGIENAKADWLVFQDADDWWYPNHLEVLHENILKHSVFQIFTTGYQTLNKSILKANSFFTKSTMLGDHEVSFDRYLRYKPVCSINVAIHKELFQQAGDFPAGKFNRGGDHETWLRLMCVAKKLYYIHELTAVYNKDVLHSVIRFEKHYTANHPVRLKVLELLKNPDYKSSESALKRFSNSFVYPGIKMKARNGELAMQDLSALFLSAFKKKRDLIILAILSLLPGFVQKTISKFY